MVFEKDKAYSALDDVDIVIGSKGYFADSLKGLRALVGRGNDFELQTLKSKDGNYFETIESATYNFFYFISKPKRKIYRAYENVTEMLWDFKKRCNDCTDDEMRNPVVWVKQKDTREEYLITRFARNDNKVTITFEDKLFTLSLLKLFNDGYTYLDGSPCGYLLEEVE